MIGKIENQEEKSSKQSSGINTPCHGNNDDNIFIFLTLL